VLAPLLPLEDTHTAELRRLLEQAGASLEPTYGFAGRRAARRGSSARTRASQSLG
jgi:tRNA U34 5-methylaminomethyl-2-thiouridine-forming methyltransferase MnmC